MTLTVYHNPGCGTSRSVLEILKASGESPRVVEYLKEPPSKAELKRILKLMKAKPRDILRAKGDLYDELKLTESKWTDEQLLDFMVAHPVLINRPIVVTDEAAKLCRPAESVRDLLEA